MDSGLYNQDLNVVGFGLPQGEGHQLNWNEKYSQVGDGSTRPSVPMTALAAPYPQFLPPYGNWYVLPIGPVFLNADCGAEVVDRDLYNPARDKTNLKIWANPGVTIVVESRALPIDPTCYADWALLNSWAPFHADVMTKVDGGLTITDALISVTLRAFDKTGKVEVTGSPISVITNETPPAAWTLRTSWPDLTVPVNASFVSVCLKLAVSSGAPTARTVLFREIGLVAAKNNPTPFTARYL